MPVVTLTTTSGSAQTWTVPSDLPVGTTCTVECWGSGSSGAGASGAGGAGGAYARNAYTITPHDVALGISFTLSAGGAAVTTTTGNVGPDCSFSTNNVNRLPNSVMNGAVVGGALPTNWSIFQTASLGLSSSVIGFGTDANTGYRYIDIRVFGTTGVASGVYVILLSALNSTDAALISSSTSCTWSGYISITGGTTTNLNPGNVGNFQWDYGHLATGYDGSIAGGNIASLTTTPTLIQCTGTSGAAATWASCYVQLNYVATATAVDTTVRIQGAQMEQAASATFWKSSPCYVLAKGGTAAGATTGGTGGATATSVGTTKFAGGNGATKAQLAGGGGAAGKDGAGGSSTTATGATGDNGSGGAANTSNIEGGGGGTGVATVGGTANSGGAPGGGGGGETGASGTRTSGAGGRGQIRITYTGVAYGPMTKPWKQRRMLLR